MERPIVQFVIGNSVATDARVRKMGRSLARAGHAVVYVGAEHTDAPGAMYEAEPLDGIRRYLIPIYWPRTWDAIRNRLNDANPLLQQGRISGSFRRALFESNHPLGDRLTTLALSLPYGGAYALHRAGAMRFAPNVVGIWRARETIRAVLGLEPRAIHAHDLDSFRLLAHAASRRGVPIVYDSHELERGRNRPLWGRTQRWLHEESERLTIRKAARVITVAPSIAGLLAESYGIETPLVLVNSPPRANVRENRPLRERLGLPPSSKVILYLGGITFGRGLEDLVQAMRELPPHVHLLLMGPVVPSYANQLRDLLNGTSARSRIHLREAVPYQDVIHEAYGADLGFNGIELTCESYRHALPNKFFEYVFADVPVLSSPTASVTPLTREYSLGRIYEGRLADNVEQMLREPARIPAEQRRAFIDRFCWESQEQALLDLYATLIAREGARSATKG
jgi:glycosyltransferase involved in cell wall biosynthesis